MKTFASFWWVFFAIAVMCAFFAHNSRTELEALRVEDSGVGGFFTGLFHGLAGDTDVIRRHAEQQEAATKIMYFWNSACGVFVLLAGCSVVAGTLQEIAKKEIAKGMPNTDL